MPGLLLAIALSTVGALGCGRPGGAGGDAGRGASGASTSQRTEPRGGAPSHAGQLSPTSFTPESASTVAGPFSLRFEPSDSRFEGVLTLTLVGSAIFHGPAEYTRIEYAANLGDRTYILLATNSGGSGCVGVFYVLAIDRTGRWAQSMPFADCLYFSGAAAEGDGVRLTFGGGPEGREEVLLKGRELSVRVERPERDAILALPMLALEEDKPVLLRGRVVRGTADTGLVFELERRMRAKGCAIGPIDSLAIDAAAQGVSELKGTAEIVARVACLRSRPIIVSIELATAAMASPR